MFSRNGMMKDFSGKEFENVPFGFDIWIYSYRLTVSFICKECNVILTSEGSESRSFSTTNNTAGICIIIL